MSSNSNTEREGGASASLGLAQTQVPRLAPGGYAAWRPVMENVLMRAGVMARDYKVENKDWAALVETVDCWAIEDETASIAHALGRLDPAASSRSIAVGSPASSKGNVASGSGAPSGSTTKSTVIGSPIESSFVDRDARRVVVESIVARTKKAYALLFVALTEDLRRLVAHVSQGDAYGLWIWLERRFQSTEQDNIGDLWDEFTGLSQGEDETFDEYKARVDRVHGLLAHAKDKPSAGLYAHRLLWKLTSRFDPAILALKASGKLKEADKIVWDEIVVFINNHERSASRLIGEGDREPGTAMAVIARDRDRGRGGFMKTIDCYNCGEKGHMARDCKKPRRAREDRDRASDRAGSDRDRNQGDRERDHDRERDRMDTGRDHHDKDRDREDDSNHHDHRCATRSKHGYHRVEQVNAAVVIKSSDNKGSGIQGGDRWGTAF